MPVDKNYLDDFQKMHQQGGPLNTAPVTPGPIESMVRGAGSGFTMGAAPYLYGAAKGLLLPGDTMSSEIENQRQLNDAAATNNPGYYGAGYAGGALGLAAATGGIGNAAEAAQAARAGSLIADTGIPTATSTISKIGSSIADWLSAARAGAAKPIIPALAAVKSPTISAVGNIATRGVAGQAAGAAVGNYANQPANATNQDIEPPNEQQNNLLGIGITMNNSEDNKAMQTASSVGNPSPDHPSLAPFASLVNYLKQAQNSNNTSVIALADQAKNASDTGNTLPIAMALNSTPTGRAVGNSESPLNEEDDQSFQG